MPFCSASLFDSGAVWLARALPLPCRALTPPKLRAGQCGHATALLDSCLTQQLIVEPFIDIGFRLPTGGPVVRRPAGDSSDLRRPAGRPVTV